MVIAGQVQSSELSSVLDYLDSIASSYSSKNQRQSFKYDKINVGAHHEIKNCSDNVETSLSHINYENSSSMQNIRGVSASNDIEPKFVTSVRNDNNDNNDNNNISSKVNGKAHIIFQEFSSTCSDDESEDSELANFRTERLNIKAVAKKRPSEGFKKSDLTPSVWKGGSITKPNSISENDPQVSTVSLQDTGSFDTQANIPNTNTSCILAEATSNYLDVTDYNPMPVSTHSIVPELKVVTNSGALKVSGSLLKSESRNRKDGAPKFSSDVTNRRLIFSVSSTKNLV